ncbi:MAG: hypothetical protein WCT77_03770 [Bacteroidota bacterium]|jgi:hypothetical protein
MKSNLFLTVFALILISLCFSCDTTDPEPCDIIGGSGIPSIAINTFTNYGSSTNTFNIKGEVKHINRCDYFVAVYIHIPIDNFGWVIKPYSDFPKTYILPDGRWELEFTLNNANRNDVYADTIRAFLFSKQKFLGNDSLTIVGGVLPDYLYNNCIALKDTLRKN